MIKGHVKRSQFQFISLTDATIKSVLVEGDEAFITIMNNNGNNLSVRRQAERDQAKAVAANGGLADGTLWLKEWLYMDFVYGKVNLDVPQTAGTLINKPVTTAVDNNKNIDPIRHPNVGVKEYVDLKANTATYPLNVCIETVHYVPADQIAA